jgi:hypothetical protein
MSLINNIIGLGNLFKILDYFYSFQFLYKINKKMFV